MTLNEYQESAKKTALYPKFGDQGWVYPVLGLTGEAGEVADKLKKVIRDQGGVISDEVRLGLKAELGDVLWYVSQLAHELGFTLDEVASANIAKLADRKDRDKLRGSGDNR